VLKNLRGEPEKLEYVSGYIQAVEDIINTDVEDVNQ
jgi:hypothetical protein